MKIKLPKEFKVGTGEFYKIHDGVMEPCCAIGQYCLRHDPPLVRENDGVLNIYLTGPEHWEFREAYVDVCRSFDIKDRPRFMKGYIDRMDVVSINDFLDEKTRTEICRLALEKCGIVV